MVKQRGLIQINTTPSRLQLEDAVKIHQKTAHTISAVLLHCDISANVSAAEMPIQH